MAEANHTRPDDVTVTETVTETQAPNTSPRLVLKLKKPKNDKKVQWSNETVDNEHMDKKKSKCCCIYEKPKLFGESSSEDEEEDHDDCTNHCRGHRKKCFRSHIPEEGSETPAFLTVSPSQRGMREHGDETRYTSCSGDSCTFAKSPSQEMDS